jgi:hypothetical protein
MIRTIAARVPALFYIISALASYLHNTWSIEQSSAKVGELLGILHSECFFFVRFQGSHDHRVVLPALPGIEIDPRWPGLPYICSASSSPLPVIPYPTSLHRSWLPNSLGPETIYRDRGVYILVGKYIYSPPSPSENNIIFRDISSNFSLLSYLHVTLVTRPAI